MLTITKHESKFLNWIFDDYLSLNISEKLSDKKYLLNPPVSGKLIL